MNHYAGGTESTAWSERQRAERYRRRAFIARRIALYERTWRREESRVGDELWCRSRDLKSLLLEAIERLEHGRVPETEWFRRARRAVR